MLAFGEQEFGQIVEFDISKANQEMGVDILYFYSIKNITGCCYLKGGTIAPIIFEAV